MRVLSDVQGIYVGASYDDQRPSPTVESLRYVRAVALCDYKR